MVSKACNFLLNLSGYKKEKPDKLIMEKPDELITYNFILSDF